MNGMRSGKDGWRKDEWDEEWKVWVKKKEKIGDRRVISESFFKNLKCLQEHQ